MNSRDTRVFSPNSHRASDNMYPLQSESLCHNNTRNSRNLDSAESCMLVDNRAEDRYRTDFCPTDEQAGTGLICQQTAVLDAL